jgi:preprotein translocase subunit YajC
MEVIFLQNSPSGGGMDMIVIFGLMFVVMYFFMIRPQMKKNKQQQAFREEVKKGDKIVTNGGIHGKISEVRDQVFIIDTEGGGKLKIDKSSVSMDATNALNGNTEKKK